MINKILYIIIKYIVYNMIIYTKRIAEVEHQQISEMFHQLLFSNSYYTHLQLLYAFTIIIQQS